MLKNSQFEIKTKQGENGMNVAEQIREEARLQGRREGAEGAILKLIQSKIGKLFS